MFNKNYFSKTFLASLTAWIAVFWLGSGGDVFAASTLGDMMCNAYSNTHPFGMMFQYGAYGAGCICVVRGIHHMRLHTDSPGNNHISRALMLFVGAAGLLVLPSFASMVVDTLYGTPGVAGTMSCAAGAVTTATDLSAMLQSLVTNIKGPLVALVSIISIVAGIYMMVNGLVKASKHGIDARTHSMHSILTHIIFGALLMSIGTNEDMIMSSVFGTSSISTSSVINWGAFPGGASTQFQQAVTAALTFVQLIGVIAFVRGWMVMKKVVEGGGNTTMAQGITHIVGGAVAINIFSFLQIMNTTFGLQGTGASLFN